MERLKEVIDALNRADIIKIRTYYKNRQDKQHFRRLELLELIKKGKVQTDGQAARLLYHAPPNSAFSHLKARLLDDILEVLMVNNGNECRTPHYHARIACRKKMLLSEVLIAKGIARESLRNLKAAAQIAWKNKLSMEKLLVKEMLVEYFPGETIDGLLGKNTPENARYLTHLLIARLYFKRSVYNSGAFYENLDALARRYRTVSGIESDLRNALLDMPSPELRFWYLNYAVCLQRLKSNFILALQQAREIEEIVHETPAQFSAVGRQSVLLNLALVQLGLHDWADAEMHLRKLLKQMEVQDRQTCEWNELLFRTLFFNNKLDEAAVLVSQKLDNCPEEFALHRWQFYQAVLLYRRGELRSSLRQLGACGKMLMDKTYGCDLGYRLTELILLMELNRWDMALIKLESFQQLLKRRTEDRAQRYRLALRLLAVMIHNGINDPDGLPDPKHKMHLLISGGNDPAYAWDPLGFELIHAGHWLTRKGVASDAVFVRPTSEVGSRQ